MQTESPENIEAMGATLREPVERSLRILDGGISNRRLTVATPADCPADLAATIRAHNARAELLATQKAQHLAAWAELPARIYAPGANIEPAAAMHALGGDLLAVYQEWLEAMQSRGQVLMQILALLMRRIEAGEVDDSAADHVRGWLFLIGTDIEILDRVRLYQAGIHRRGEPPTACELAEFQ